MMPYITAFFMPRAKGDRPDVIPDGCVNFAFLGQFAETPRDTIFATEYSVRTAMEAVYGLLGVDRGVPEVWGSVYDIRELLDSSVTVSYTHLDVYKRQVPVHTIPDAFRYESRSFEFSGMYTRHFQLHSR